MQARRVFINRLEQKLRGRGREAGKGERGRGFGG